VNSHQNEQSKHEGVSTVGVKGCGAIYWILFFIMFPIAIVFEYFIAKKLIKLNDEKTNVGYPFKVTLIPF
jgi:hypothetical protein